MATIFYRKNKSGKKNIRPYITFSFAGHRYRRSLGLIAHQTAKNVLAKIRVMLVLVSTGMASVPKGRSLCDFIFSCHLNAVPAPVHCESKFNFLVKAYLDVHHPPVKAESTWKIEKIHLGHFLKITGDIPLVSIDITLIEQYRKKRCTQVKPATVNKEMATLRLVLSWAHKKGWIEENPMVNIQPLKTKSGQRRFFTCSQIKDRLDKEYLSDKQKQEILHSRLLDWQDIEELISLAKSSDPFTRHMLTYYFKKLIKDTQYQGLGLHAFRHAFASHLADAGVDQRVINELMGHTSEQMSQRYRHLFPKRKNEAIQSLK